MPGKFKLTLDGQTKIIQDSPANFEKIRKLKESGRSYDLQPYDDADQDNDPGEAETAVAEAKEPAHQQVTQRPVNVTPAQADDSVWGGIKAGLENQYGGLFNAARDLSRGVRHGSTLSFDDELAQPMANAGAASARLGQRMSNALLGRENIPETRVGMSPGESAKEEIRADQATSKEESPWLYGTGNVMGGIGTGAMAAGPITALAGRVAGAGAGAASRFVGQTGNTGLPNAAVQRAAQALAQQQAQAAGQFLGNTAVMGGAGLLGAAQGAGEAKPGETAEGASTGFALGAGMQGATNAVGAGLTAVSDPLKQMAQRIRNAVAAPNKTMMKNLQERFGVDRADQVMGEFLEKYIEPSSSARSADDYIKLLSGKLSEGQRAIAAVDEQAGKVEGLNGLVRGEWDQVVKDQADEAAKQVASKVGNNASRAARSLQRAVGRISTRPDPEGPLMVKDATAPADLPSLREKIGEYGDDAFSPIFGRKDSAESDAAKSMWGRSKDAMNKLYDEYALPETSQKYYQTNKQFSEMKALEDALKNVSAGEGSSHLGTEMVSGTLAGAGGGAVTAATAGANPIAGAMAGAQMANTSGTNPLLRRLFNSSQAKDRQANFARGLGHYAGELGDRLSNQSAVTSGVRGLNSQDSGGEASGPQPITSTDVVKHMLRYDPQRLGPWAQEFSQYEDDPEQLQQAVERKERQDKDFAAMVQGELRGRK